MPSREEIKAAVKKYDKQWKDLNNRQKSALAEIYSPQAKKKKKAGKKADKNAKRAGTTVSRAEQRGQATVSGPWWNRKDHRG